MTNVPTLDVSDSLWRQGEQVEVTITDLSDRGDGVGRYGQRVVFVPDTVTGDRVLVRLVRVKPQYAHGKLMAVLEPSPERVRPGCIVADKCGGCQWQHVSYAYQLEAKQNLVLQALERIGGLPHPHVDAILAAESSLSYRNKATYPLRRSASGQVQAGYYQKGSHQLVNLNQCPIQDARLNPLLAEVKQDIQERGWSIYSEAEHRGKLRHLSLRIGRRTGEMLLTLVSNGQQLPGLAEQALVWRDRYPDLVGVCLNYNPDRTNAIFGTETTCLWGRSHLVEELAGLQFQIQADTFFQIHTEQAEQVLNVIAAELALTGTEVLLDAFCGIGTLTLPLAQRVQQAVAIELQPQATELFQRNADLNQITNVDVHTGSVEAVLPTLVVRPDIVLLDPPRKGCEPSVLDELRQWHSQRIVYVSCNPATLARDLKRLCADGAYRLERVQPIDFFPQTAHVECVAFLRASNGTV